MESRGTLACLAETITDLGVRDGHKKRPWLRWGFVGESVRYASWGRRGEDVCVVLSGAYADVWWREVYRRATNVSRIDLAVTVQTDPPLDGVAWRLYEQLARAGARKRKGATASCYVATDGSSTAYLGRRISDKYFRCYDKWRESGTDDYRGCWRYELECKNAAALDVVGWLSRQPNWSDSVAGTVYSYVHGRGGQPIFAPLAEGLQLATRRPDTDLERQCQWLAKSIGGTAREVALCLGADALLGILGVDKETPSDISQTGPNPHGHHGYESYGTETGEHGEGDTQL